jgi:hypothetical protein
MAIASDGKHDLACMGVRFHETVGVHDLIEREGPGDPGFQRSRVLALQITHLMRHRARQHGIDLSFRELLRELAVISKTVLLYPGDRGRPRAQRMLTETAPVQDRLADIFGLDRYAPRR